MTEFLRTVGSISSICIGTVGVVLAFAAAFDWALGKVFTYWRGYKMLVEYAMHHKEFKAWKEQKLRGA